MPINSIFEISVGIRQGDALSVTLFNLALDEIVHSINKQENIFYSTSQICECTDVMPHRKLLIICF